MTISQPEVSTTAKLSALTWLHHKSEREVLMNRCIAEWPIQTAHLAKHIQEAIDAVHAPQQPSKHWVPSEEEKERMAE